MKSTKNIVIDARIIDSSTGVYIQRLLHFLHRVDNENSYIVLVPSKSKAVWQQKFDRFSFVDANQPSYSFSEQLSLYFLLRRLKPDLVHFCMPQQPLLWRSPSVTTIHDTILIRYDNVDMNPVLYSIRKRIFIMLVRRVIKRSKYILSPTNFVRNDLIDFMGKKYADKFKVTPLAGDPVGDKSQELGVLNNKDYLAFVGNAFPYKNVLRVIKAYAVVKKTHPELRLALAGKKDYFYDELEKYVVDHNISDVHFLGFISHGEKRWLLGNARAFVTASLSEGFCIPLLEAMYEGCPVLSSNVSCLPEVAGEAALYFDPHSTEDLAAKIEQILGDPKLREDLVKKGYSRVKDFSWERMAQQTLDVYKESLDK